MSKWFLPLALCAALTATAQVQPLWNAATASNSNRTVAPPEKLPPDSDYARFVREIDASTSVMMKDMRAPPHSGDPDIDFLAMMIPHHEAAVEMARLALVHGRDPATRRLAEEIVASQTVEIASMKTRLASLRTGNAQASDTFPTLGGTRGSGK